MGLVSTGGPDMPVSLTAIDCVAPVTFSALSVRITFSLSRPAFWGVNSMGRSHCPAGLRLVELVQAFASPAPSGKSVG